MSPNVVLYTLIFGAVGVMVFAVLYGDEQGWGAGLTTFKVRAQDPAAALQLLDPLVRQWLMSAAKEVEYELSGRYVLAYMKQRDLDELRPLLDAAVALRDQVSERLGDRSGGGAF